MYRSTLTILLFAVLPSFGQTKPASADSNAVKVFFFDGLRYKIGENYNKAIESFHKVIAIDPNQADAYYEIANLDYRQNKLQESEFAIRKAIQLDPENIWYWKLNAELYKRKGDMSGLVLVLDHLIKMDPELDAYYFDRCNALAIAGDIPAAMKGYDELEKKFGVTPASTKARKLITLVKDSGGNDDASEETASDGSSDVKSYLYASSLLFKKGKKAEAFNLLKKAKALDPSNLETDLAMVDYYVAANNFQAATDVLKETVKTRSDDPRLFAMYGDLLYKQGDANGALVQYLKSMALSEKIYVVWEQVLNIYLSQKEYKKAIATGTAAIDLYPNQAILFYYLAVAQYGDEQYKAAQENIRTAEDFGTEDLELQASIEDMYALILMKQGAYDPAKDKVKKALQINTSKKALYLEHYGDILFQKGDKEEAIALWKQAMSSGNQSETLKQKINEKKYIK